MLGFAFCRPCVDAPQVGGAEFLEGPFGGKGDEELLIMSNCGKHSHGCSLPFERGGDVVDIVKGLLGHELGEEVVWGLRLRLQEVLFCVLRAFSGGRI